MSPGEVFAFLGPNGAGKTYGVDGIRGALIGLSQFGFVTDAAVLTVVASAFLVLGAWSFSRIQV